MNDEPKAQLTLTLTELPSTPSFPLSPPPSLCHPPWLCVCVFLGRLLVTSYEYFAHALPTISHFVRAMTTTTPQPPNPYPYTSPFPLPCYVTAPSPCSCATVGAQKSRLLPASCLRSHTKSISCDAPSVLPHPPATYLFSTPSRFPLLPLPLLWFVFLLLLSRFRPTMTHSSSIGLFFTMLPLKPAPPSSLPIPLAIILPLATQPDVVANTISVLERERRSM